MPSKGQYQEWWLIRTNGKRTVWISYKGDSPGVYPFDEIPPAELCFKKFSHSSEILFFSFFFISTCLMVFMLSIFPNTCSFLLFHAFWFFLDIFLLLFVFFHFSLLAWYIFLYQIPFLYLDCIFLLFVLVFFHVIYPFSLSVLVITIFYSRIVLLL